MARTSLKLPPTRNHRQLANLINAHQLVDDRGRPVAARIDRIRTSTDQRIPGTRLRRPGKGRQGLRLEIWPVGAETWRPEQRLYQHESSETYRRHDEARAWVEQHLRMPRA